MVVEAEMNNNSEDVGGWFDSMVAKDIKSLRDHLKSIDSWDDSTLKKLYGAFCKDFYQCEWRRATKDTIKQFEKILRIQNDD